jgi:anti-sigma factor RsiW
LSGSDSFFPLYCGGSVDIGDVHEIRVTRRLTDRIVSEFHQRHRNLQKRKEKPASFAPWRLGVRLPQPLVRQAAGTGSGCAAAATAGVIAGELETAVAGTRSGYCKHRELFLHAFAAALGAIRFRVVAGYDALEGMTAVLADVFKDRHSN